MALEPGTWTTDSNGQQWYYSVTGWTKGAGFSGGIEVDINELGDNVPPDAIINEPVGETKIPISDQNRAIFDKLSDNEITRILTSGKDERITDLDNVSLEATDELKNQLNQYQLDKADEPDDGNVGIASTEIADGKNWARRVVDSRGSHFRIESGSPLIGLDGSETVKIYACNDNEEVFMMAHGHGSGLARMACDKTIEVRAGDKNDPNNIDIRISAATGDITINADRGRVRVEAKDIMLHATRDVDINADRNLNLKSGSGRILLKGNTCTVDAKRGNVCPESYGAKVTKNSNIPDDTIEKVFSPQSQKPSLGAGPGGFDGVAGGAVKGYGFALEDLGISGQTGGKEAVEKAIAEGSSDIIPPLQTASNLLKGNLDESLGDVLKASGASDILGKVKGGLDALDNPLQAALGLSGVKIPGSMSIAGAADKFLGGTKFGSAMNVIKGVGGKVLTGNISSLTAGAMKSLGVKPGGSALTGLSTLIGSGSVAKGAAATVSNMTSDALASLPTKGIIPSHPDLPSEQQIKALSNSTAMYMESLKGDFLRAANTPNVLKKVSDAAGIDIEKRLLAGEEIIGDIKDVAAKFKLS